MKSNWGIGAVYIRCECMYVKHGMIGTGGGHRSGGEAAHIDCCI